MPTTDPFAAVTDQVLDLVTTAQSLTLAAATQWAEAARSLTPTLPSLPLAKELPDPVAVTERTFGFAEKLLASQRKFSLELVNTWAPAKPATRSSAKETAAA